MIFKKKAWGGYLISLFDSLAHPTLSENWPNMPNSSGFQKLSRQLKKNNFCGALAVGIWSVENYSHHNFIRECRKHPELVAIAGFAPNIHPTPAKALREIKELGFAGIKIHPRFNKLDLEKNFRELEKTFEIARQLNLVVLFCTYYHCATPLYPGVDPLFVLVKLMKKSPQVKVVLVHGGGVELMRYAELARFNQNILLDLSLTIMKYPGSSLDLDLKFLFKNFDRRICVGSDFPEYSHSALRKRFEYFSKGLTQAKKENIGFKNVLNFFQK